LYLNDFEYYAPGSAGEAFELYGRMGDQAKVLAGGTDLLLMMKQKLINCRCLIDINGVKEFQGIEYEAGKGITIGAATKISELESSTIIKEKYHALYQAAGELGSAQVRAMATVGGNNCNASPAAETTSPLVVLKARAVLNSTAGEREMPLEDFILGNRKTALKKGELLVRFLIPDPAPGVVSRYANIGLRDAMEIDAVNMAVSVEIEPGSRTVKYLRLVMGSVSPRPLISIEVPALLEGREYNNDLIEKAAFAAAGEAKPISDIRASAEYRREVVSVLARRLLHEAFSAAEEVKK